MEAKLPPVMAEALRRRRHGARRRSGKSWYADETYLKVHGQRCYLYWAIDRDGHLVDTMLSATRDMRAAKRFFRSDTVGCWFCARPGDHRWAPLLPARDPFNAGPQSPSQDP